MNFTLNITRVINKTVIASLFIAALLTQLLAAVAQVQPTGTGKTISATLLGQTLPAQQESDNEVVDTKEQIDATNQQAVTVPAARTLCAMTAKQLLNKPNQYSLKERIMQTEQKELIRSTFAQVAPIADQAAALFYGRLFELAPEVKPLFKHNMEEQGRKLMQMIGVAVANLDKLDVLVPAVQAPGQTSCPIRRRTGALRHRRRGLVVDARTRIG